MVRIISVSYTHLDVYKRQVKEMYQTGELQKLLEGVATAWSPRAARKTRDLAGFFAWLARACAAAPENVHQGLDAGAVRQDGQGNDNQRQLDEL